MPRHTLFAYVEGDLDGIQDALQGRLQTFVDGRRWVAGEAWVVNQHVDDAVSCTQPEDNPCCWDLGLNLHLPDPGMEPVGWFADVEAVARFLGNLHAEFGCDFVIGIGDAQTGIAEDLYWIDDCSPDLEKLAKIVGLGSIR
jgi:hypothetical protein